MLLEREEIDFEDVQAIFLECGCTLPLPEEVEAAEVVAGGLKGRVFPKPQSDKCPVLRTNLSVILSNTHPIPIAADYSECMFGIDPIPDHSE